MTSPTSKENESVLPRKLILPEPGESEYVTEGLSRSIGLVESADAFGDSGDMFDHMHWRDLFALIASTASGTRFINGLGQKLLLRGQSEKRNHKQQAQKITFEVSTLTAEEKADCEYWKTRTTVDFYLNYPTETSKVGSRDLTSERLKCLIRPHITTSMMRQKRLPATSMAIGYGKMVLDMQQILTIYSNWSSFVDIIKGLKDEKYDSSQNDLDLSKVELDTWLDAVSLAMNNGMSSFLNLAAAYAGSISSKEIYEYDENVIKGTVYWSGLHAMMTDVCNKNKAMYVTADIRERYASSSFYDDFKRKMAARKMALVNSQEYIFFLKAMSVLVPVYVYSSTQIKSEEEVQVIDSIMAKITNLKKNSEGLFKKTAGSEGAETTHTDPDMVKKAVMKTAIS